MTQPLDINKLARETAKECWSDILQDGKPPAKTIERHILAALTKLAAEEDANLTRYMAALSVAMNALKTLEFEVGGRLPADSSDSVTIEAIHIRRALYALTQIEKELKP